MKLNLLKEVIYERNVNGMSYLPMEFVNKYKPRKAAAAIDIIVFLADDKVRKHTLEQDGIQYFRFNIKAFSEDKKIYSLSTLQRTINELVSDGYLKRITLKSAIVDGMKVGSMTLLAITDKCIKVFEE